MLHSFYVTLDRCYSTIIIKHSMNANLFVFPNIRLKEHELNNILFNNKFSVDALI